MKFPYHAFYVSRQTVCCGVIYIGELGEVMVDQRYYKKCDNSMHHKQEMRDNEKEVKEKEKKEQEGQNHCPTSQFEDDPIEIDEEIKKCDEVFKENLMGDGDEGFCDLVLP